MYMLHKVSFYRCIFRNTVFVRQHECLKMYDLDKISQKTLSNYHALIDFDYVGTTFVQYILDSLIPGRQFKSIQSYTHENCKVCCE